MYKSVWTYFKILILIVVENLRFFLFFKPHDNDLIKIYNYFNYKGYYNIVSVINLNFFIPVFYVLIFSIMY